VHQLRLVGVPILITQVRSEENVILLNSQHVLQSVLNAKIPRDDQRFCWLKQFAQDDDLSIIKPIHFRTDKNMGEETDCSGGFFQ
jgi:hypothetical protein